MAHTSSHGCAKLRARALAQLSSSPHTVKFLKRCPPKQEGWGGAGGGGFGQNLHAAAQSNTGSANGNFPHGNNSSAASRAMSAPPANANANANRSVSGLSAQSGRGPFGFAQQPQSSRGPPTASRFASAPGGSGASGSGGCSLFDTIGGGSGSAGYAAARGGVSSGNNNARMTPNAVAASRGGQRQQGQARSSAPGPSFAPAR